MSSGELFSSNLPSVGPIWWALPLVATVEIAIGGAIYFFTPKLVAKIRTRNTS